MRCFLALQYRLYDITQAVRLFQQNAIIWDLVFHLDFLFALIIQDHIHFQPYLIERVLRNRHYQIVLPHYRYDAFEIPVRTIDIDGEDRLIWCHRRLGFFLVAFF
jgi:hypothetical protein